MSVPNEPTPDGDPFSPPGVVFRPVSSRLITVRLMGALAGLGVPAAALAVGGATAATAWLTRRTRPRE